MKIIPIKGVIGWDVTPDGIREQLTAANGDEVTFEIASPGGFIAPGLDIFNQIRNYAGHTTAKLTGFAMSMASYIPLASDHVVAEDNAVFMVHNAQGITRGDHNEILKYGNYLKGLSGVIASRYVRRTGKTLSEVQKWMDDETFFFGEDMVAAGFVDEIIKADSDDDKASAMATAQAAFEDAKTRMNADQVATRADMSLAAAMVSMIVQGFDTGAKLVDEPWDKTESEERWRNHAGISSPDDLPNNTYSKRFAYVSDKSVFGGHHFPIWDFKDGAFVNIAAVRNGLSRLPQAKSVPDSDKPKVEKLLRKYLDKFTQSKEEQQMTLQELLSKDPAAKAEFDAALAAAKAEGVQDVRATIKKVSPFLNSSKYPAIIGTTALNVLNGEGSMVELTSSVAAVDAVRQDAASKAAAAASGAIPETPGQQAPAARKDGEPVASQADLDAEIARYKEEA